jgi:prepilin-type N-terminal cleavage/methylation domain-containing protein
MLRNKTNSQKGFTIIEVLIVLAIAGLILLIVFLAVPALQRNSRNTAVKTDASAVGATIQEYEDSNNGQMPTTVAVANGVITVSGAGTQVTGKAQGGTTGAGSTGASAPSATQFDVINAKIGVKCNTSGNAVGAASGRSVAILYNLETASGAAPQCLES